MRFKRLLIFGLISAAVTILCHARVYAPINITRPVSSNVNKGLTHLHEVNDKTSVHVPHIKAKKPSASNDTGTTAEETPVTINVVANDTGGGKDDEDDKDDKDDKGDIDPGTVDLDPPTGAIDQFITTSSGNYSVNGSGEVTYVPVTNFTGISSVNYTVNSKEGKTSNPATLSITVSNVNDAPVITGQTPNPLTANEEQSITITLSHLLVTDPDDNYPQDFTLTVSSGDNYTVSGSIVTPAAEFSGTLSVPVIVNDGEANSNSFNLQISVAAVNDPPVITGQSPDPLTTAEDQPVTIDFSNLLVSDPDGAYPSGFTLSVSAGTNYSVSETTVTPAADFVGTLTVPITVNDGAVNSNTFDLEINVSAENDVPIITGQSVLSVDEDNSITIMLSNLTVTDNDNPYPAGFSLALSPGTNYTLSGTTVIPAVNYSGALSVQATVNDGTTSSAPFDLQITVNSVNDVPEITGQVSLSTSENQPIQIDLANLTVSDPDDVFPADFTLSVQAGTNYSVSGNLITPASGFNGVLTAGVLVNDGAANSLVYNLQITVTPVNDPPVITGQIPLSVAEDNTLTLLLSDLTVTDADNTYPTGFALSVLPGTNYTVTGNSILPSLNYTGTLSVSVIVNDGSTDSAPFSAQVNVTSVNDAPQITGQQPLSVSEDQSITLQPSHFVVTDPDNIYPNGFTLMTFAGTGYTLSGNTIIPSINFQGTLNVQVQVSDGLLNSNIFLAQITVTPVNDAPVITGQQPLGTLEDTPVTIQLSHLTVIDADNAYPSGFTLAVSAGLNYSVSGTTITPALDFTGTLNISVSVSDGTSSSAPFIFQIQVGDTNDPPIITGQVPLAVGEEQPLTIELSHLTVSDPDNPYPTGFSLIVSQGVNFTIAGNTVTPMLNFAGILTVPVRVNDGVNNSPTFELKIQVDQINDPPGFDAIPNQRVAENSGEASVAITNISRGPGEGDQQLTFVSTSGNTGIVPDPVIHYNPGAGTAILTYKPVPNTSGTVTITVLAIDNGSSVAPHRNSYASSFQIEVTEINSAPTLETIANVVVAEDAAQQSIALLGITAGAGESQPLTVEVSADKPELFEILQVVYTSPEATGSLQIKPKANASGVGQITVKVLDNGSSVAPSVNLISRSFTFTIQPVNDPPLFVSSPVLLAAVNEPYEYIVEISDIENNTLPLSAVVKPAWTSLTSIGAGKSKLSGTPPSSAAGSSTVKLQVTDGSMAVEQQYSLIVNNRPVAKTAVVTVDEDASYTFQALPFTQAYEDADQQPLSSIKITQNPGFGKLLMAEREIKVNDTIPVSSLGNLVYKPGLNYDGQDAFYWKASDGYHFSIAPAAFTIDVRPINDGPMFFLETDSLHYEVNGEPAILTSMFEINDPDDDSLAHADIGFRTQNYRPELDMLLFQNTVNIKGTFDFQSGKLALTGKAPIDEYQQAIRSIQYTHLNTLDPHLELKTVFITLHDGKVFGETKERIIELQYTFIELEIPSGFTPNGDNANDTWIISRPGGLDQLDDAIIKVYSKRGVQVFYGKGFERPWDGTMNGEALPADTYFFTIDLKLRSKKTYKGIVTILR